MSTGRFCLAENLVSKNSISRGSGGCASLGGMVLLPLLCLLARASSYSSGAPPAACASLTPGHGGQPGDLADSPYLLEVEGEEGVVEGEELLVTLRGAGFLTMQPFMGFLIQVLNIATLSVFDVVESLKTHPSPGARGGGWRGGGELEGGGGGGGLPLLRLPAGHGHPQLAGGEDGRDGGLGAGHRPEGTGQYMPMPVPEPVIPVMANQLGSHDVTRARGGRSCKTIRASNHMCTAT